MSAQSSQSGDLPLPLPRREGQQPAAQLLWPPPCQVETPDAKVYLSDSPSIQSIGPAEVTAPAEALLRQGLEQLGVGGIVRLRCLPSRHGADESPPESYRLSASGAITEIFAADAAGLRHGAHTWLQWIALHRDPDRDGASHRVPALEVEDAPDFPHRGVQLDISRDKVPTLATLERQIDQLAGWKINQLQLYMEHTFAYEGHEVVWKDASPLTPDDIRHLDAYCRQRGIELVPNQNSFGHFHRWLIHDAYRDLAECPDGIEHPFSDVPEPFSLCPIDERVPELLADLYDQLLPCFESRMVNVGCDETFELGQGRSKDACDERGRDTVYLEFLRRVHGLLAERGRRMQFWGDILLQQPGRVGGLPEKEVPGDAIALAWGYEAQHPFAEQAKRLADAGLEFYLCPGTSSWNSFGGRVDNLLRNLDSAARAGRDAKASGLLVCDWGDWGHLQPLPVSEPGLFAGAGAAWNAEALKSNAGFDTDARFAALLDHHVFLDEAGVMGKLAVDVGNAYRLTGAKSVNGSSLFFLLKFAGATLEHERLAGLRREGLDRAKSAVLQAAETLAAARMQRPDAELVLDEWKWVTDLMVWACDLGRSRFDVGVGCALAELPELVRAWLAERMTEIVEGHGKIWHSRNRTGGQEASVARLQRLVRALG